MCQGAPYACAQLMATTPSPQQVDNAPDWLDAVANSHP